jgi:hypothetical protein
MKQRFTILTVIFLYTKIWDMSAFIAKRRRAPHIFLYSCNRRYVILTRISFITKADASQLLNKLWRAKKPSLYSLPSTKPHFTTSKTIIWRMWSGNTTDYALPLVPSEWQERTNICPILISFYRTIVFALPCRLKCLTVRTSMVSSINSLLTFQKKNLFCIKLMQKLDEIMSCWSY